MNIKIYYEDKNHPDYINVPDEECAIWEEKVYQQRIVEAGDTDKTSISRRTAQEIMEDICKSTFNNNHTETRRHCSMEAYDPDGNRLIGSLDVETTLFDEGCNEKLRRAIATLTPAQKELVHDIYWKGMKQTDIANRDGVSNYAITDRKKRIHARLKELLSGEID